MKVKKTIMVALFLLCLLVLGAVSAADNDAIVGSDVTEGAACLNDAESSLSDDVMNAQDASSSQGTFTDIKSENVLMEE